MEHKPTCASLNLMLTSNPPQRAACDCGAESPLATQVGGNHYTKLAIQPMTYSMANNLDACQHTIVKYVTRFRDKGGIQDLEKAKHVIDMLIQFETEKQHGTDHTR